MNKRNWKSLHKFESEYKRNFLRGLTEQDSIKIFAELYQFAQRLLDKRSYKKICSQETSKLKKVHSMFMRIK